MNPMLTRWWKPQPSQDQIDRDCRILDTNFGQVLVHIEARRELERENPVGIAAGWLREIAREVGYTDGQINAGIADWAAARATQAGKLNLVIERALVAGSSFFTVLGVVAVFGEALTREPGPFVMSIGLPMAVVSGALVWGAHAFIRWRPSDPASRARTLVDQSHWAIPGASSLAGLRGRDGPGDQAANAATQNDHTTGRTP
jgi:hypothetical protein